MGDSDAHIITHEQIANAVDESFDLHGFSVYGSIDELMEWAEQGDAGVISHTTPRRATTRFQCERGLPKSNATGSALARYHAEQLANCRNRFDPIAFVRGGAS